MKIRRVGAEFFHTDGWTDMTKSFFYVLLTVHLSIILVINQLDAQIIVL